MKIGSIESITGGLFASKIVEIPGASNFFKGALVVYSNDLKEKIGIDTSNGVINENVARQMALKGKEYLNVDICFSFTGNAGPEALDNMPVGKVFIGINEDVFELDFVGNRQSIRNQAVEFAMKKAKVFATK